MQIQIDRHYTLKETADGKLEINKHCHRDNAIVIFPRVTNVIDIS